MDSSQNTDENVDMGIEKADMIHINEDHTGNNDESVLEIPTFGFTEKSWRTDFVVIVEGTRLYVNKAILSLASPVLDTMFQSGFKESSCDELELHGKKLRDVIDFLRYIYPNTFAQITPEGAANVLPLVEEYQVIQLKPRCEATLLENVSEESTVQELFQILHVACLYNLVNLRKRCVQIACIKSQKDIDEAFENNPPPAEAAKEILEQLNEKLKDMLRQATASTVTLKENNIKQERQLTILKQYLSADVKKNKVFSLESDSYWRDITTILDVDIEKRNKAEKEVKIWNVTLRICVSDQNNDYLKIEIRGEEKIKSKLKGRVIIVNRQPQGENVTFLFDGLFSPNLWYNVVSKNFIKMSTVKDIDNGFLSDGHIGVIVQVYMSEPNRG